MRRLAMAAGAALVLLGGAGAAVVATQATTTTELITVPYTIAGQTGQVVLTDTDTVQTVTETVTVTVTSPPTTTTTPTDTTPTDTTPTTTTPPPPTTISGSTCTSRASTAGAVIENVTVTGNCSMNANNVTIRNATIQGAIEVVGANAKVIGSSANRVGYTSGADGLLLDGNVFDGHGTVKDGITMWANAAGDPPRNWVFRNNTFKNFYVASDPSAHSQAIYNGYSTDGLIENNLFVNNGTTSHIFFTWWTETPNSNTTYPRNICVRGNTFRDGPNVFHYYAINFRAEIPTSANIKTDPNEPGFSTTSPQFNGVC